MNKLKGTTVHTLLLRGRMGIEMRDTYDRPHPRVTRRRGSRYASAGYFAAAQMRIAMDYEKLEVERR